MAVAAAGEKQRPPRPTLLIARSRDASDSDLVAYPDAPAAAASRTSARVSCTLSMRTRVAGARRRSSRVAATPSMPGNTRSRITRSGLVRSTSAKRLARRARGPHHGQLGIRSQHRPESLPEHRVVVDDQ
jgi:hypothetical protein